MFTNLTSAELIILLAALLVGLVIGLAGHGVKVKLGGQAADLAQFQLQKVEIESPVFRGFE